MHPPGPELSPADAVDCAKWILSDIARRPRSKSKHQQQPLRGEHICKQPSPGYFRGSDLTERIYVAVRVLERSGHGKKEAYCQVAALAGDLLGKSRRGKPRTRGERDVFSKMKTVASLVRRFHKVHPDAESLVDYRTDQFLLLRRAGVLCGSEYVENSGQKMHEFWRELVAKLLFKPIISIDR